MTDAPASILRIAFSGARMRVDVRLSPATPHMTTPALARRALAAVPTLAAHICINDRGPTFAAVIEHTPLPHLLEHLVIDAQVRDPHTRSAHSFVGTTAWTDESSGLARIEVNFDDDLVALSALESALTSLTSILAETHVCGPQHEGAS